MVDESIKVLVVDDDQEDFIIVRDFLSRVRVARYEMDWAPGYEEALERLKEGQHDVCLLDYRLGDRNGLEWLQEAVASGSRCPIIFFSGKGDYQVDLEAMKSGASDYLVKGEINPPLLERSIRYAIERRRVEEALREHRSRLEEDIRERTKALMLANEKLTRSIKELERRTNEILALNHLGELLQVCESENETYSVIKSVCQQFFPGDSGYVAVLSPDEKIFRVVALWGKAPQDQGEFESDQCWAIRRGKVHVVQHPEIGPPCSHLNHLPKHRCLCAPMSAQGEVVGMMHLCTGAEIENSQDERSQTAAAKQMLVTSILELYGPSLTNLRLRETLKLQSISDPLTRLYNRRYMDRILDNRERRAKRQGDSVGIILMDVDHFKTINDTYGHEMGDILLQNLGAFLKKHTRSEDFACRYGGEEFVLILPGASLENTRKRAEELWKAIKEEFRINQPKRFPNITLSLGVAVFPDHGSTIRDTLHAADTAMYRAKAEGRDRVIVASISDRQSEKEDSVTSG
jgi:diguanylate cyclase (GGDEF)-like protein